MRMMERKIWMMIKAVLLDKRVVLPGFLLLVIVFIDFLFLNRIFPELDIPEHFLFGFVLSESASKLANVLGLDKHLMSKFNEENLHYTDLLIRLLGFLLVGGLLWELSERFLFPMFEVPYNPFFTLPITLHNIDGAIDVAAGTLGCIMAWWTKRF